MIAIAIIIASLSVNVAAQGGETIMMDSTIIEILNSIQCPVLVSEISDSVYTLFSLIDIENISLVNSWIIDDKVVELYKGEYGGFLSLYREGDRILCAQYVNDSSIREDRSTDIPSNAYSYTLEASASGMYVKTIIAFFTDGQSIRHMYRSPTALEPYFVSICTIDSILGMVKDYQSN